MNPIDNHYAVAGKQKSTIASIVNVLLNLYFVSAIIAIPYFNFRYANRHGFVSWLLFGEIVATGQAFAWPFFAFNPDKKMRLTDSEKDNLEHFHLSRAAIQQAQTIMNSGPTNRVSILKREDSQAIMSLYQIALKEGNEVDLNLLTKIHPDLPKHYREEYLPALELMVRYHEDFGTFAYQQKSNELWDQWVDWYNANVSGVNVPKTER